MSSSKYICDSLNDKHRPHMEMFINRLNDRFSYYRKSEEKLQWMYKGDKPEADDYLLGKRIDRHIEQDDQPAAGNYNYEQKKLNFVECT